METASNPAVRIAEGISGLLNFAAFVRVAAPKLTAKDLAAADRIVEELLDALKSTSGLVASPEMDFDKMRAGLQAFRDSLSTASRDGLREVCQELVDSMGIQLPDDETIASMMSAARNEE